MPADRSAAASCDGEGLRRNKCPLCEATVCYADGDWLGHTEVCPVTEYRKTHVR